MPTTQPGDKILVTGANGYIPIWVVNQLLEKGYTVRATVRTKEKGKHLEERFKSFGEKLELCVVEDITAVRLWGLWVPDDRGVLNTA